MSIQLFLIGYVIATTVGFVTYYINIKLMWITIFTLMPVVFGYLFYLYLKKAKCIGPEILKETNRLVILWIVLSFLFDALFYILMVPILFNQKPNWTFFIDQSPWIWLNYTTIFILGHVSRFIYLKNIHE